jgi:hypothetical protein
MRLDDRQMLAPDLGVQQHRRVRAEPDLVEEHSQLVCPGRRQAYPPVPPGQAGPPAATNVGQSAGS